MNKLKMLAVVAVITALAVPAYAEDSVAVQPITPGVVTPVESQDGVITDSNGVMGTLVAPSGLPGATVDQTQPEQVTTNEYSVEPISMNTEPLPQTGAVMGLELIGVGGLGLACVSLDFLRKKVK